MSQYWRRIFVKLYFPHHKVIQKSLGSAAIPFTFFLLLHIIQLYLQLEFVECQSNNQTTTPIEFLLSETCNKISAIAGSPFGLIRMSRTALFIDTSNKQTDTLWPSHQPSRHNCTMAKYPSTFNVVRQSHGVHPNRSRHRFGHFLDLKSYYIVSHTHAIHSDPIPVANWSASDRLSPLPSAPQTNSIYCAGICLCTLSRWPARRRDDRSNTNIKRRVQTDRHQYLCLVMANKTQKSVWLR